MSLSIRRGDDYTGARRIVASVVDGAGAPTSLTGTALTFMVKRSLNDADSLALLSKTVGSGITLASPQSGATLGVAYIALASADTASLSPGSYTYELEGEDAVGVVTLVQDIFELLADVVRS